MIITPLSLPLPHLNQCARAFSTASCIECRCSCRSTRGQILYNYSRGFVRDLPEGMIVRCNMVYIEDFVRAMHNTK